MATPPNTRENQSGGMVTSFPTRAEELTASDATVYHDGRQVYVGTAGDVAVEPFYGGNTLVFTLDAGQYVPCVVRRVLATGTTASGLVGVY